jgi:hypothetical protein
MVEILVLFSCFYDILNVLMYMAQRENKLHFKSMEYMVLMHVNRSSEIKRDSQTQKKGWYLLLLIAHVIQYVPTNLHTKIPESRGNVMERKL